MSEGKRKGNTKVDGRFDIRKEGREEGRRRIGNGKCIEKPKGIESQGENRGGKVSWVDGERRFYDVMEEGRRRGEGRIRKGKKAMYRNSKREGTSSEKIGKNMRGMFFYDVWKEGTKDSSNKKGKK